jgi:hypothetical protein
MEDEYWALRQDREEGSMSEKSLKLAQMADWDIVANPEAMPAERYAAEEFQRLFAQAMGIQLPIRYYAPERAHHVYIGPSAALTESGVSVDLAAMGEEAFQIIVGRDRIAILGGRPRGTLYGVYQFLEDALGVRFLTYDHTHVPDPSTAQIPCGESRYDPPFSFRWSFYGENTEHPEFATRLRVNTVTSEAHLGGKTGQSLINHSFHWLVPFEEYGEAHPEYYALVDGVRDTDTHLGGPQLCVTNPDVIQIATGSVLHHLDEHPDARNVSVSQADTARYCRCEVCEAINQREGSPMGAQLAFVNAVAERIENAHPEVKIGTLAYWYTRQPPATIRPRHNVQIQLCSIECCTLHPIDDPNCPRNQAFCRDMAAWRAICDDIWVWNYNTNFHHYDLPFPNLRSIGPNVRFFRRSNVKGLFMQASGNGLSSELSDLRNYLIARLIWNPELDDRAVLEEFARLHYQSAAGPILQCIDMFHDHVEQSGVHPDCFPSPDDVGLRPEVARRMLDYYEQALCLAENEAIRARVEKASICAYRALIEAGGPMEEDEGQAIVERYIMLCRRYNMTHVNERDRFDPKQVQIQCAAIELSPGLYEAYAGRYELIDAPTDLVNGLGETITLSVENERFLVETRQGKMQFHPETETLFAAALDRNITLQLLQDDEGRTTELAIKLLDGREIRAQKVR